MYLTDVAKYANILIILPNSQASYAVNSKDNYSHINTLAAVIYTGILNNYLD